MGRPYKAEQSLSRIGELSADATDDLTAIIAWAEAELSIAQQTFDKPRQGRVASLMIHVSRLTLAVSNIQSETRNT